MNDNLKAWESGNIVYFWGERGYLVNRQEVIAGGEYFPRGEELKDLNMAN